jgi:CRP/FNR family transcriptional regulator, nitrogen oxide reductase regulator
VSPPGTCVARAPTGPSRNAARFRVGVVRVPADPLDNFVASVALFRGVSAADRASIVRAASRVRAPRGARLFHQGDPAAAMYVLVRGKIKLRLVHQDGQEVIIQVIGRGDAFGAVAALEGTTYPVSAETVEPVEALAWDSRTIAALLTRHPTLAINALRIVTARMLEMQARFSEQVADRVEHRLAQAILRLAGHAGRNVDGGVLLDMPLSRRDLAELAGTTLYTASRIVSRWQSQGLIDAGRQRLLLRNPHGLVALTERAGTGARRNKTSR